MRVNVRDEIKSSIGVKQAILNDNVLLHKLEQLANECVESLKRGGKIIFAGNGGSFADAQHLSAEFVSRFMSDREPLASVVLGANNSAISAIANDYGYEQVFARELTAVARVEDVFIPISTSGESANLIAAVKRASELNLITRGLTGGKPNTLCELCDCLSVPSKTTARIQEAHIMLGHILCGLVEQDMISYG